MDPTISSQVYSRIEDAIKRKDLDEFHRVTKEYPQWPENDSCLGYLHDISTDSLETFKAFVERFPQTKDWDCGHMGNPVGIAAIRGDISLLKYLLEDLGHKANAGEAFFRPVLQPPHPDLYSRLTIMKALYAVHDKANRAEVIKILKEHGATREGEGTCYQKSHRLLTGKLCWHRGGEPESPRCSWSANALQTPKEKFERIFNVLG
jgi:hypothetical protein